MAIRYDTVDDGGAFCKVVLEEPGDVIQFAREACADPQKWDLFEAPMLQRLLMIFQERVEEALPSSARQASRDYQRGVDQREIKGWRWRAGASREMTSRSVLVGAKLKADLRARSRRPGKTGVSNLTPPDDGGAARLLAGGMEPPSWTRRYAPEVKRHEASWSRLRRILRSA